MGTVRECTGNAVTQQLTYEAFAEMAEVQMESLANQASEKWGLIKTKMVHRIGVLDPGEIAVAVAVSSAHRDAAFEAGRWLLDEIKKNVPIWKKEHFADGSTEWQHPSHGVPDASASSEAS